MTASLEIDDALMRQIEAIAKRSRIPTERVVESALRHYLDTQHVPRQTGPAVNLPVSSTLADPKVDVSQSLGKLLEACDEGLPLEKLR